jgi:transcriptional regulator of acetoin/glycerol metabolism
VFPNSGARLTADAERALLNHSWPGNVRELRNVLQRAALLAGDSLINAAALNLPAVLPARSDEPVLDRATIERVLAEHDHIVAQAARQLGISRAALYRRMEKLGIKGLRPKAWGERLLPEDGPWPAGPRSGSAASRRWPCSSRSWRAR